MQKVTMENVALMVLRVVVAAIFIYAGYAKWGFWSGSPEGMSGGMVYLIKFLSIVEPLGGVALLVGFLTRWASAGLAIIMVGAIGLLRFTMNMPLFTSPQGMGLDYNFLILAICFYFSIFGAGSWSIDEWRKNKKLSISLS